MARGGGGGGLLCALGGGRGRGGEGAPLLQSPSPQIATPPPAWRLTVPAAQPGGTCGGPWGGSADLPRTCVMGRSGGSRRHRPRRPVPSREAGERQAGGARGVYSACGEANLSAPLPSSPQAKPFTPHPVLPTDGRGPPLPTKVHLLAPSTPFPPFTPKHHPPKSLPLCSHPSFTSFSFHSRRAP